MTYTILLTSINNMSIKLKDDTVIGSCNYYYYYSWNGSTRRIQGISFDTETILDENTEITITGTSGRNTYTIDTTIGNLISSNVNLTFSVR